MMLYNRSSINYYIEIMFLRRSMRWFPLPAFMPRLIGAVTGFADRNSRVIGRF